MRNFILILTLFMLPMLAQAAGTSINKEDVTVKSESKSAFKGLLYRVWGKFRSYSPRITSRNRLGRTVTAGVRGAETTGSVIQPYWKDDQSSDPVYIKELTEFTKAQQLAEDGKLKDAVTALSDFIDEYDESDLRPNAQFALGVSYGGLGQNEESVDVLTSFVDDNPEHPLVSDARQVIAELK